MSNENVVAESALGQIAYSRHVNPQWVRLLSLLERNAEYVECRGETLRTAHGRTILDFLSGYCVHNVGHNYPRILDALHAELDRSGPCMLGNVRADYRDAAVSRHSLTQICGNNSLVLKAAPPLNVSEQSLEAFVRGLTGVLEAVHSSKRF